MKDTFEFTEEIRVAYSTLSQYAADNYDTAFRPAEAGVSKPAMQTLTDAGLAFLEEDGTVTLSEEYVPTDHEAPRSPEVSRFADTGVVRVLVESNPKRAGTKTHARFELYYGEPTVLGYIEAAMAAGCSRAQARNDLRWDVDHGHITVG